MTARRKSYLLALVSTLAACSDSDLTGVETKRTAAAQEETIKREDDGPVPVNKCAVYRTLEFCELE